MFVCICNSYRDSQIREAAESGMTCVREIYRSLGRPPRCGRCLEFAAQVIAEVQTDAPQPVNALAEATA